MPSQIDCNADDAVFIHGRRDRGEQISRDKDRRRTGFRSRSVGRGAITQVVQDAFCQIAHVRATLFNIRILHPFKRGGIVRHDAIENRFHVSLPIAHPGDHLVNKGVVLDDQKVGIENSSRTVIDGLVDMFSNGLELITGSDQGILKTRNLTRDGFFGNLVFFRQPFGVEKHTHGARHNSR